MAQGGQGWPAGQYNPSTGNPQDRQLNGDSNDYNNQNQAFRYQQYGPGTDSSYMYMDRIETPWSNSSGAQSFDGQPAYQGQQFSQSVYSNSGHGRVTEEHPHHQQQGHVPSFAAAQPGQSQGLSEKYGSAWTAQATSKPSSSFVQQPISQETQNSAQMYQQQFRAQQSSQPRTSVSSQQEDLRFAQHTIAGLHSQQNNGRLTPQPQQFQYPVSQAQFSNSSYSSSLPAQQSPSPSAAFQQSLRQPPAQNPRRDTPQHFQNTPLQSQQPIPRGSAQQLVPPRQLGHPSAGSVGATKSASQASLFQPGGALFSPQPKAAEVESGRPDALAAFKWKKIEGCPGLSYSETPVPSDYIPANEKFPREPSSREKTPLKFNATLTPLLPKRQHRLPFEIKRDLDQLKSHGAKIGQDPALSAGFQVKIRNMEAELEQSRSAGPPLPAGTVVTKKPIVRRKPKTGNSPTGADLSDSSSYADSDSEDNQIDIEAREILKIVSPGPIENVKKDIVKALWIDSRQSRPSDFTQRAVAQFGVIISKLWGDIKKVRDDYKVAKEKGAKQKELDELKEKLNTMAECLCSAFKTANKFGDEWTVSQLGFNEKMLMQVINAWRYSLSSEPNGALSKALLLLVSKFTTVHTSYLKKKVKMDEVETKYAKKLDNESKAYLEAIWKNAKDYDQKHSEAQVPEAVKRTAAIPVNEDGVKPGVGPVAQGIKKPLKDLKKPPAFTAKDLLSAGRITKGPLARSGTTDPKKPQTGGVTAAEGRKVSNGGLSAATSSSSAKRPRDDESDTRVSKKVAVDGAPKANGGASGDSPQPATGSATVRPRAPGSILPGRVKSAAKPVTKKPSETAQSSGISNLLAMISAPAAAPKPREEKPKEPETPQQEARRLRKESRRSLRVTWKPDHELTEVRTFQHDVDEDEGRADNMVRDARDLHSEGQMLKEARAHDHSEGKVLKQSRDLDDDEADSDDDEGAVQETGLKDWVVPSAIDFASIAHEQRAKTFATRGGLKPIESHQKKVMEDYERRELMVVYTSSSEIPESPKEPPRKAADEATREPVVWTPPAQLDPAVWVEMQRRWYETTQLGPEMSRRSSLHRLAARCNSQAHQPSDGEGRASSDKKLEEVLANLRAIAAQANKDTSATIDLASTSTAFKESSAQLSRVDRDAQILVLMQSDQVQKWKPTSEETMLPKTLRTHGHPDAMMQSHMDLFESAAAKFAGQPHPSSQPPEWVKSNPNILKQWQTGHNNNIAARAAKEATEKAKKLAEEFAAKQAAATAAAAAAVAAPTPTPANLQGFPPAWAAYYAQLAQSQAPPPVQAPAPPQNQGQDQHSWLRALQIAQASQVSQAPAAQQPPPPPPAAPAGNADLAAILAALGQPQPQASSAAPYGQPAYGSAEAATAQAAFWQSFASNPQSSTAPPPPQQQQRSQYQDYESGSRGQQQQTSYGMDSALDYDDSGRDNSSRHDRGGRSGKDKDNRDRGGQSKDYLKGINRALIGTKPCVFWAQGKCAKGDQCTFRHDPNDLK